MWFDLMLSSIVLYPQYKKQWTEHTAVGNTEDQNGGAARRVANLLCTDCIVIAELKSLNSTLSYDCPLCPFRS